MATDFSIALGELLDKTGANLDFLREAVQLLAQELMELEVSRKIGAQRHERTAERVTYRNGYRHRTWDTRVGTIDLRIPKLRQGSYFPSLLEPRRRAEKALVAVVQEAYIHGVSTRKVDELVQSLGMTGISKSEVSRLCSELDELVEAFRHRPLTNRYPYVWLDAKYIKVRESGRVLSMALVVAVGVTSSGDREVLGLDVGLTEDGPFWTEFLRDLVRRGLSDVRLVISDAHEGLKEAITRVLGRSSWQRCRVHFMRNLLSQVPKSAQQMVAALVRTIFAQPDKAAAHAQLAEVAKSLALRFPKAAQMLRDAEEEILAYMAFPTEHWRQLHSTNPLERLMREIGRRTDVVGIFPNRASLIRLAGAVLMEQQDEWMAAPRRYFSLASMSKLYPNQERLETKELLAVAKP
jgi:Transposase and inactivated derivatives